MTELKPFNGILYDLALDWAIKPSNDKLLKYLKHKNEIGERLQGLNKKNSFSLFRNHDIARYLAGFFLNKLPKNKEDLEKMLKLSLKGKKVLEIGANLAYSQIFNKNADYQVSELEGHNRYFPEIDETLEEFYKRNDVNALFVKNKHLDIVPKNLEKTGPFDIICSYNVWADGTSGSYDPCHIQSFLDYNKHLKPFGLVYHYGFPFQNLGGQREALQKIKEENSIVMLPGGISPVISFDGSGVKIK